MCIRDRERPRFGEDDAVAYYWSTCDKHLNEWTKLYNEAKQLGERIEAKTIEPHSMYFLRAVSETFTRGVDPARLVNTSSVKIASKACLKCTPTGTVCSRQFSHRSSEPCSDRVEYPEEWETMQFYVAVGKVREAEFYHWQTGRAAGLLKYANQRCDKNEPVELGQRREALLNLYYRMSAPEVQVRSRETQRPVK